MGVAESKVCSSLI